MRVVLLLLVFFIVSCANKRKQGSPALMISKIESLPSKSESTNRGIKIVTEYQNFFVKNYFDSDSSALITFITKRLPAVNDSVNRHYSFYIETDEVNINSVKANPQLLYENERELLIKRFSVQNNHLIIYFRTNKGKFKIRSERL